VQCAGNRYTKVTKRVLYCRKKVNHLVSPLRATSPPSFYHTPSEQNNFGPSDLPPSARYEGSDYNFSCVWPDGKLLCVTRVRKAGFPAHVEVTDGESVVCARLNDVSLYAMSRELILAPSNALAVLSMDLVVSPGQAIEDQISLNIDSALLVQSTTGADVDLPALWTCHGIENSLRQISQHRRKKGSQSDD